MKPARALRSALKLSAAMLALGAGAAHAQTSPSQTPPGATAEEPSPQSRFTFPPAQGLSAPAGAESVQFALNDIVVEGQFAQLEAQSAVLEARHAGRQATVAEIYAFAADLQQAYFEAGYPLARVTVPPQDLNEDGRVRVVVVDGFVESIDTSQLPRAVRARVENVLSPLVGLRQIKRAALERRLLLAGDTAGLALTSTLTPGANTGATVLVLQGEHDLVSGVLSADNRVSDQLGESQATVSLALNSPFGAGERFVATFAGHPESNVFTDEAVRRYLALGMTMPIGVDGLMFGLSADYSSTRPEGAVAPQALHSEYSRVGASLTYPFLRSRAANVVGRAQFDAVSDIQRTELGGPPEQSLSADRLRVLRLRLDGDVRFGGGARVEYGLGVSQGFDGMGARSASEASVFKPLTRAGADAEFSALDAEVRFSTPALFGTTLALSARAQDSFGDPLLRSEQFSPTSWDGLTGPPPGAMIGDSGGVARIELGRAFGDSNATWAPYAFASGASVSLEQPTALEAASTNATAFGAGMRLGLMERERGGHRVSFVLEYANVESRDADLNGDWTTAAIAIRF